MAASVHSFARQERVKLKTDRPIWEQRTVGRWKWLGFYGIRITFTKMPLGAESRLLSIIRGQRRTGVCCRVAKNRALVHSDDTASVIKPALCSIGDGVCSRLRTTDTLNCAQKLDRILISLLLYSIPDHYLQSWHVFRNDFFANFMLIRNSQCLYANEVIWISLKLETCDLPI